ncbi:ABC transporter ATP-binding protein [Methylobacterium sp. Leaf469]|nr:ABC transporter ATP-binding protein [Methylobacterium sp. Leaf102]KQT87362.1 ABC transporter ATP-binding protein [Methylobacterium sp. Leaf469]
MSAMAGITLTDIRLVLNRTTILDSLSLAIPPSGITALVGPNGAGKSATLRVIDGLLVPTGGSLRVPGAARRAFVFQKPALIRASAAANVALGLVPLSLSRPERRERTRAALARVGLAHRAGDPATRFSGGEQQRLALARAWAARPDLLLLDEPTANLDPSATELVEALIAEMAAEGTKVVLVSHNLAQVARLAADVIVLARGRAVEHGPTRTTLLSPRTPEARAYFDGELPWTSLAAAS